MIKSIINFCNSRQFASVFFNLLLITFPFGAHILSFSIGFMTIYPSLICLLGLTFLGFFHFKEIKYKLEKYSLIFMAMWFLYGLGSYFFVEGKADAMIDVRNLFLMLCTTFVFLWVKNFLGIKKWLSTISFGLSIIYLMLILFSIFEVKTGIHFASSFTDKMANLPMSVATFAPQFLFGNPNNLATYVLLIGIMLILINYKKPNMILTILIASFFINHITSSRLGEVACLIVGLWFLIVHLTISLKKKNKTAIIYVLVTFVGVGIALMSNPLNITDKNVNNNPHRLSNKVDENSQIITLKEAHQLNKKILESKFDSKKIRIGLFLNGLEMIKQSNGIGVGVGQGRYLHKTGQVKYYTKTNIGFHCWLMEILAQYGIFIFVGYIVLILVICFNALKNIKSNFRIATLIITSLMAFFFISMLPSGFLVLNINWIFFVFLLIYSINIKEISYLNLKDE